MDRPARNAPYRDAALAPEPRARDLLAGMTLEEKVAQRGGAWSTALVEAGVGSDDGNLLRIRPKDWKARLEKRAR